MINGKLRVAAVCFAASALMRQGGDIGSQSEDEKNISVYQVDIIDEARRNYTSTNFAVVGDR
jgi:hypothetical protein